MLRFIYRAEVTVGTREKYEKMTGERRTERDLERI